MGDPGHSVEPPRDSYPGGVSPGAVARRPLLRPGWAGARDVLLVVLATALQVLGPRSGSPGHVPDLLAGLAGINVGVAAALVGGVALWWRRSRPAGVLAVSAAGYAVNAAVVPGVPPYAAWVALYAAGVYGGPARRAGSSVEAGAVGVDRLGEFPEQHVAVPRPPEPGRGLPHLDHPGQRRLVDLGR